MTLIMNKEKDPWDRIHEEKLCNVCLIKDKRENFDVVVQEDTLTKQSLSEPSRKMEKEWARLGFEPIDENLQQILPLWLCKEHLIEEILSQLSLHATIGAFYKYRNSDAGFIDSKRFIKVGDWE